MSQINAYLTFNGNCREAMIFYKECLGEELVFQTVGESPLSDKMPPQMKDCILHSIELDTEKRVVEVPIELQKLLDKNADAKKKYEKLSYTNQKELVFPIKQAKTEETRNRNIEKAIDRLINK
jgi:Bacteriocin-protection, YdeI or OmpD-Associated